MGYLVTATAFVVWPKLAIVGANCRWLSVDYLCLLLVASRPSHHSPVRVEILTSFYKHPVEILINGFLSAFILYVLLGLSPQAVTITVLITGIAELFYHWNVRTPYWLGFLFQRPESHCLHHRQGYHRNNFSDLPLWDMLFGTFENPRIAPERCGFTDELERQIVPMLLGKDVLAEDFVQQVSQPINSKGKLL